jgi:hypothetical protein
VAAAGIALAGCGGGDDQPSNLRKDEGGDERGNRVPVRVVVTRDRVQVRDAAVPSFLALRFRVVNRLDRRVRVVVLRDGEPLERVAVPAGGREVLDVEGQPTGRLDVRAAGRTAKVAVEPGG